MSFANPSDSAEILYGASGDVRNELNAYVAANTAGHYADETEIPGSLIVNSLRKATRVINIYLEPVYADQIPFQATASVPKMLDEIASDLAVYYTLRSLSAKVAPISTEKKRDYYDVYVEPKTGILDQLRERKLQLPELTAGFANDVQAIRKEGRAPIFDMDKPTNWEVDSRLIEDIEQERQD